MNTISKEHRKVLRDAWRKWGDAQQVLADEIIDGELGDARDDNELAQCLRAMGRVASMCLTHRLDFNDPDFPLFFRQMDDRYRYGGPDLNIAYFMTALRGDASYRVRGNNAGRSLNLGTLWQHEIATDQDGTFEVNVSADESAGNWSPLASDLQGHLGIPDQYPTAGAGLTVRRYDWDWDQELAPGWLSIERVDDAAPDYPASLDSQNLADQIINATKLFNAAGRWWIERAARVREQHQPNVITPPSTTPPGVINFKAPASAGKPWLYYGIISYDLDQDDAIFIETDQPDGDYWSFTLYNVWWESPDIMNRQTSLNQNQAHIDDDGKVRFVIAPKDPGVPNWLDSGDGRRGFLHYRWFRPDQSLPEPVAQLVRQSDVRQRLPKDHPEITPARRKAILSRRREQLAKRFQR